MMIFAQDIANYELVQVLSMANRSHTFVLVFRNGNLAPVKCIVRYKGEEQPEIVVKTSKKEDEMTPIAERTLQEKALEMLNELYKLPTRSVNHA